MMKEAHVCLALFLCHFLEEISREKALQFYHALNVERTSKKTTAYPKREHARP